eukprot:gb/GEZJ01010849.1/.p1 GENE.gb/GEZJ01010849.1/~~gb/GEZJ01010849.1/.p1  ORF type:complete len:178 (+),score=17.24 gb/GEZJ01010849.1/:17-550(+)
MKNEANEKGHKRVISQAVKHFPALFRSHPKANLQKASRMWKAGHQYLNEDGFLHYRVMCTSTTRSNYHGMKRTYLKARIGRGRKISPWVEALHSDLVHEFDRLRKLGVKFKWETLQSLALSLFEKSTATSYHCHIMDDNKQIVLSQCITRRWIQIFTDHHRIVSSSITGKHLLSLEK